MHIRVIIWVNNISNHVNTRAILPRYEGFGMIIYRSEDDNSPTLVRSLSFNTVNYVRTFDDSLMLHIVTNPWRNIVICSTSQEPHGAHQNSWPLRRRES